MRLTTAVFLALVASFAPAQQRQTPTALAADEAAPPWALDGPPPPKLPVQEIAGPREFLALLGIDASQLGRLTDRRPLHPDEYEPLYRILYRIPRFSPGALYRWRLTDVDWDQVAQHPADYRAASIRLTGRVTRIEKESLLPEAAQLLEFEHFYRIAFEPDNAPWPAQVCARWIPRAWKIGQDVSYRASVDGLLLKLSQSDDGRPELLVVCQRVAWRPDAPDSNLGVAEDHVLLASRGLDLGQFDLVQDRAPLTAQERECFYQLLDAARRIAPPSLRPRPADESDLALLLQTPHKVRGRRYDFVGQARRVQEIRIEESDIRQRFGIDRYYEIDVFLPLERQKIKMGEAEDSPVFEHYYPLVFCVAQLPPGMTAEEVVDRQVRIPAFSFKLWAYKTEFMRRHSERAVQLSPMLIGRAPEVLPVAARPYGNLGALTAGLVVLGLAAAWLWVWRMSRADAAWGRQERRRRLRLDETPALENLEARPPDFSNLPSDEPAS